MNSRGPARHVTRAKSQNDFDGQVKLAYCCPIHGRFEVLVQRDRILKAVECRHWTPDHGIFKGGECRALSPHNSSEISIVRVFHG